MRVASGGFGWPPPTAGTRCRWRRTGWSETSHRPSEHGLVGRHTYIATDEGWLFLAVVIDLFSRRVVGWSLRPHMQRSLVIDALEMAWHQRRPDKDTLLFHSDRGSQYASEDSRSCWTSTALRPR